MVTRAGLPCQDLEFVQFHPTGEEDVSYGFNEPHISALNMNILCVPLPLKQDCSKSGGLNLQRNLVDAQQHLKSFEGSLQTVLFLLLKSKNIVVVVFKTKM